MNQLDFQVTIHIPENEVTPSGEQIILLLEQCLMAESLRKEKFDTPNVTFKRLLTDELTQCSGMDGVPHGVEVEIGGVDINWGDPEGSVSGNTYIYGEHAANCACNCCRGRA